MESSKISSIIGFAIKAGKVKRGVNAIALTKGKIPLMIICHTASENTRKDAMKLKQKFNSKMIECELNLEDIVHKDFCKLIGITDNNFVTGILNNLDENFKVITEA